MTRASSPNSSRGVALVVLSSVFFGAMGMVVKRLAATVSIFELVWFRSIVGLLVVTGYLRHQGVPLFAGRVRLLIARGLFGGLAMVCYFSALSLIPLADAVVLNYTSPAFTLLIAAVWLGERPTIRTGSLVVLALVGVVLVAQPSLSSGEGSTWGYVLGLGAGIFSGLAYATVKRLTRLSSPWLIVWYFGAVTAAFSLPPAIATWRWPSPFEWLLLIALSLLGTGGQLLMTDGFRHGTVSRTSIATVAVVVVAALGGWALWDEIPSLTGGAGMLVIALSILGIALREGTSTKAAEAETGTDSA